MKAALWSEQAENYKSTHIPPCFFPSSLLSFLFSRSGPCWTDVHQGHAGGEAGPLGRHVCGRPSHRHEL